MSIEAFSAESVAFKIDRYGCALWRRLLNPLIVSTAHGLLDDYLKFDGYFANIERGTLHYKTVHNDLMDLLFTRHIAAVFGHVLGKYEIIYERNQSIVLTASSARQGTIWHQEAETIPDGSLVCWVNLTERAGMTSPGLGLVTQKFNAVIPEILKDDPIEEGDHNFWIAEHNLPIAYPIFGAGDAVFFDRHTIHRTHRPENCQLTRVSFKITAVKV